MKNIFKILMVLAISVLMLPACQKDPDLRIPDLQKGAVPLILKDTEADQTLDFFNLGDFAASVSVDHYFDDAPAKITLMVSMNGSYDNVAVLQDNITTYPTSVNFTSDDLVNLLPELDSLGQIELGDYFRVFAITTLEDGTVINGMDTLYSAYGDGVANLPGSSVDVRYTVVCPFDATKTAGSYFAYSAPSAWNASGDVTITADPDDPYTVYLVGMAAMEGLTEDGDPIPMHINPATYEVIADPTVIATDYFGYTNGTFGGKGTYDSCTGKYTMTFNISVAEGNFGAFVFELTPNE